MKRISILAICMVMVVAVGCGGNSNSKKASTGGETKAVKESSEAVDLGLSVKWAKTNLGAKTADDPGNYYAWGETVAKKDFSSETYKFKDGYKMKKYVIYDDDATSGTADKLIVLEAEDDAAAAALGKGWRMPTRAEALELFEKCTLSFDKPGVVTVTGPNGNSIDFPKSGYYSGTKQEEANNVWVWTASMGLRSGTPVGEVNSIDWHEYRQGDAICFGHKDCYCLYRSSGVPIRPVKE